MRDRRNAATLPRWFALSHDHKRRIDVRVMKYYGAGVHYHVSLTEEDDSFYVVLPKRLSKRDRSWHKPGQTFLWKPFDLPAEMRGRTAHMKFNTPDAVSRYVGRVLKLWGATDATHEVSWDNYTDEVKGPAHKWFYKDGD